MAVPSVAQLAPVARFAPPPSDAPRRTKTGSCFSSISGAQLDSLPLLFSRTFPGLAGSFVPARTPLACCFIYKNSRGCESGQLEKRTPYSCRCCLRVFTRKVECRMLSRRSRFGLSGRRSTVEGVPLKIRSRVKPRFYCRKNNVSRCIRSQTQLEYFFEFRTGAGSSKNVKCDHRIVVNLHLHKHLRSLASDISISNVTREETSSVENRSDVGVKISENGHQTNDEEDNSSAKSQVTFTNSETTEHSGSRSEGQTSTSSSSLDTVARGNFDNPALLSSSEAPMQTKEQRKIVRNAWEALVRWSRSWQMLNAHKTTDVLQKTKKVVVVGGGSFGTAMAVLLARNKSDMQVSLLLRDMSVCESINANHVNRKYFPNHQLPLNVIATADAKDAFEGAEYCIHAVPVQYSAAFLKSISEHVPPSLPFFSVSKGLELSTLEMMSQVIPRALGNPRQPVVVISGPSFSIELMDELPTALVAASKDKELARAAQQLLASRYLRINTSSDVIGVEIAGALKNVLAIAAGIVEGMNLGNNCMAALVAQGCSEIRWLAEKMGAKSATLAGLSGTGDIMLTCFVKLSRNRSVGVRLGSGEPLGEILASMNQVAEGVATAGAVIALARKYRVQMPVLTAVARILENELTPKKAVLELMSLPQVEEV